MTCCPHCGHELEAKRKRRCQLPADWQPDEVKPELSANRDVAAELEKFRDHWKANGEVKTDWDATWRNWLRNAPRFAPRHAQVAPGSRFAPPEHPCAGWMPDASLRSWPPFQQGLVFETEENAFRRSPTFAACKSRGDAEAAFRVHLKVRWKAYYSGAKTPKNPEALT